MPGKLLYNCFKTVAGRNYRLARVLYDREMTRAQQKHREPPILLHQMGKVGSKSIRATLRELDLDRSIYHTHHLAWHHIAEIEAKRREFFRTERYTYLQRSWLSRFIRKQLADPNDATRWKVITLTRDPIARNLSGFFQNVKFKALEPGERYEIESHYYNIAPQVITLEDLSPLFDLYWNSYRHDTPLSYFDEEIDEIFGTDVFGTEFPKDKGYHIYPARKGEVLVIRLENLNTCAEQAIQDFLGIKDFKLTNINLGDDKVYAPVYKKFKSTIQPPAEYLDRFYDSKYVQHFYTDDEVAGFRGKWTRSE